FSYSGGTYPGLGGSCAATLASGATCRMVVTFAPHAATTFTQDLDLDYTDTGGMLLTASVALTRTGTVGASLLIRDWPKLYYDIALPPDGSVHDYGARTVGSTNPHTFFITNVGTVDATSTTGNSQGAAFALAGGGYPSGTCGAVIKPGQECTVIVNF